MQALRAGSNDHETQPANARGGLACINDKPLSPADAEVGVDEGNAFGVAFLTPAMAKLLLKVSEKQVTPRSEAQLRSRAEQACDEGEPPVMESVR